MKNYTRVPNAIIWTKLLTKQEKLVLITLLSFNPPRPSYKIIQKCSGIKSRTQISEALKGLKFKGLIKYVRGFKNKANQYQIQIQSKWILPDVVQYLDISSSDSEHNDVQHDDSNKTKEIKINNNKSEYQRVKEAIKLGRNQFEEAKEFLGYDLYQRVIQDGYWKDLYDKYKPYELNAEIYKRLKGETNAKD
jgi:hypothetical protein